MGTNVNDIPGVDGAGLIRAVVAQGDERPGWVDYDIINPLSGAVQTKMSYVQKLHGVYLGCGIYKTLAGTSGRWQSTFGRSCAVTRGPEKLNQLPLYPRDRYLWPGSCGSVTLGAAAQTVSGSAQP